MVSKERGNKVDRGVPVSDRAWPPPLDACTPENVVAKGKEVYNIKENIYNVIIV